MPLLQQCWQRTLEMSGSAGMCSTNMACVGCSLSQAKLCCSSAASGAVATSSAWHECMQASVPYRLPALLSSAPCDLASEVGTVLLSRSTSEVETFGNVRKEMCVQPL